jgi:low temperature requirement protein LtrA
MSIPRQPPIERNPGAQLVSWLELFYDLVFVATIVTFSEAATAHPDLDVMVEVIVSFAAVWWIWLATTLLANRFPVDDVPQRALVLAQMLLLLLIALNVGDGIDQHEGFVSGAYALLCLDVAVMYARHTRVEGVTGAVARARRDEFALGAVLFAVAALMHGPARFALWGLGFVVLVVPSIFYVRGPGRAEQPVDEHHLIERLGLLTIIVCGEAFVKVALISAHGELDSLDYVVMSAMFLVVFAVWWSYFDDIPRAGLRRSFVPFQLWFLSHLWFQVSVVGIAVGFAELVSLDNGTEMDLDRTLLTAIPIGGSFLALAALGACTRRRPIRPLFTVRLGAAVLIAVLALVIAAFDWMDVKPAAALFAAIALGQAAVADRVRRRTQVLTK